MKLGLFFALVCWQAEHGASRLMLRKSFGDGMISEPPFLVEKHLPEDLAPRKRRLLDSLAASSKELRSVSARSLPSTPGAIGTAVADALRGTELENLAIKQSWYKDWPMSPDAMTMLAAGELNLAHGLNFGKGSTYVSQVVTARHSLGVRKLLLSQDTPFPGFSASQIEVDAVVSEFENVMYNPWGLLALADRLVVPTGVSQRLKYVEEWIGAWKTKAQEGTGTKFLRIPAVGWDSHHVEGLVEYRPPAANRRESAQNEEFIFWDVNFGEGLNDVSVTDLDLLRGKSSYRAYTIRNSGDGRSAESKLADFVLGSRPLPNLAKGGQKEHYFQQLDELVGNRKSWGPALEGRFEGHHQDVGNCVFMNTRKTADLLLLRILQQKFPGQSQAGPSVYDKSPVDLVVIKLISMLKTDSLAYLHSQAMVYGAVSASGDVVETVGELVRKISGKDTSLLRRLALKNYATFSASALAPSVIAASPGDKFKNFHGRVVSLNGRRNYLDGIQYAENGTTVLYKGILSMDTEEQILIRGCKFYEFHDPDTNSQQPSKCIVADGIGKTYYKNGNFEFEGEGHGAVHDEKGDTKYRGNFKDGMYDGKGILRHENGELYIGNFKDGMYDGKGILFHENGATKYEGNFKNGKYDGTGTLYVTQPIASEVTERGLFAEAATVELRQGSRAYSEEDLEAARAVYDENGTLIYKGGFKAGKYEGEGSLYDENETLIYKGGFKAGKYEGEGSLYHENGAERGFKAKYEGEFKDGVYDGYGILRHENGIVLYNGDFRGGKYDGKGALYDEKEEEIYCGYFKNGVYDGEGRLYQDGREIFRGKFENGNRMYDGN